MSKLPLLAIPHTFYLRPAPGWLEILHEEATELIAKPLHTYKFAPKVTLLKGTVKIHRCDFRQGLELLLRLTTAHDVEWLILESKCQRWSEVEAILNRVPWSDLLPKAPPSVHVSVDLSKGFTESSAKLRNLFCQIGRVTHVSEGAEVRFKLQLRDNFLRVLVSLAGDPLYQRGYKIQLKGKAPLPEHHAAACLRWTVKRLSNPSEIRTVFVPFAGSGTFGFESALYFSQTGTGAFARHFACELFPITPLPTLKFLRNKLHQQLLQSSLPKVIFNEFHSETLLQLRENTQHFPNSGQFEIWEGDFFQLERSFPESGVILVVLNPPFGNRLAKDFNVARFYSKMGARLRQLTLQYPQRIVGSCLCPDPESWKSLSKELRSFSPEIHHFTHGGKEMRIVSWTGSQRD